MLKVEKRSFLEHLQNFNQKCLSLWAEEVHHGKWNFFFGQVSCHYNDSFCVFIYIKIFLLIQFFLSRWLRRAVQKYPVSYNRHVQPYTRVTFKPLNIQFFGKFSRNFKIRVRLQSIERWPSQCSMFILCWWRCRVWRQRMPYYWWHKISKYCSKYTIWNIVKRIHYGKIWEPFTVWKCSSFAHLYFW